MKIIVNISATFAYKIVFEEYFGIFEIVGRLFLTFFEIRFSENPVGTLRYPAKTGISTSILLLSPVAVADASAVFAIQLAKTSVDLLSFSYILSKLCLQLLLLFCVIVSVGICS